MFGRKGIMGMGGFDIGEQFFHIVEFEVGKKIDVYSQTPEGQKIIEGLIEYLQNIEGDLYKHVRKLIKNIEEMENNGWI